MARKLRVAKGDEIYHVYNRANAKTPIFIGDEDFLLFKRILIQTIRQFGTRVLSYCIMPNHWHLLLYPRSDGELSLFMKKLTETHAQWYHRMCGTTGTGHIYQDRYKSILVEDDRYLLTLYKYIESNPLRASLVERSEDWKWSSLNERLHPNNVAHRILTKPPTDLPPDYPTWINEIDPLTT